MITRKQFFLILFALLSFVVMVLVLRWSKSVTTQLQNPDVFNQQQNSPVSLKQDPSSQLEGIDFLVSDFDALLSESELSELYEGEQDYGFISPQE